MDHIIASSEIISYGRANNTINPFFKMYASLNAMHQVTNQCSAPKNRLTQVNVVINLENRDRVFYNSK